MLFLVLLYNVGFFTFFMTYKHPSLKARKTITEKVARSFKIRTQGESEAGIAKRIKKKLSVLYKK